MPHYRGDEATVGQVGLVRRFGRGGGVTLLFWSKTSQHFAIAVFAHLTRSGFHKGGPT
jgi:hypothetical protein